LRLIGVPIIETRFELIGVDAVHRGPGVPPGAAVAEVRARVAGRTTSLDAAQRIGREVTALWLNGPAGGGGARRTAREVIGIVSVLVPREQISTDITILES